ncbi:MAG: ABC transporter substrate-binding protein [Proteobacteria bacterium]|nr:ABC transporter substrate-binding protein [Pseudomonadota bacterium]MDA1059846.1 ABC transporter substrate-binding protein [Pseudomonadota bacterium]
MNLIKKHVLPLVGAAVLSLSVVLPQTASSEELTVALRMFGAGKGNPFSGCNCTPGVFAWSPVFETLTTIKEDGSPGPMLADRWEAIEPTRWRFHMVKGNVFSNGEPVDAHSVKATFDFWWTDAGGVFSQAKTMKGYVSSIEVVDDYTIDVITATPNPILPVNMRDPAIVAGKDFADRGIEGITKEPVGSGPYTIKFTEENAVAVPNPMSKRKITSVDKINFLVLPEAPARTQALVSGQIDINTAISPDEAATIEAAGMKVYARPSSRNMGITLVSYRNGGPADSPMSDVRVRQALNYAVNKKAIAEALFLGKYARPSTQPAFPGINGYNPAIVGYPYNPEKAKQLLAEAGFPNGKGLKFEVHAIVNDENFKNAYEAAIQDIKSLGVDATLLAQQFAGTGQWLEHWLKGDWPYEGFGIGFDLTATMDAGRVWEVFASCLKHGGKAPYFCDQGDMPMINDALEEFDPAKRLSMLKELGRITTEKAPIIFLVEFDEMMGYNPRIKNFSHHLLQIPYDKFEVSAR